VPYVFVPSKAALGRACGVARPVSISHMKVRFVIEREVDDETPETPILQGAFLFAGDLSLSDNK